MYVRTCEFLSNILFFIKYFLYIIWILLFFFLYLQCHFIKYNVMKVKLQVFEFFSKNLKAKPKVIFEREYYMTDFMSTVAVLRELFSDDASRYYVFTFTLVRHG